MIITRSLTKFCIIILLLHPCLVESSARIDKLKPEEVIAKHLQSIGTENARWSVKTRIIAGSSQVVFLTTPVGKAYGKAVLASEGSKSLIGMSFESPIYPREQFGFNGNSFIAAFVTPGVRSSLGSFLMTHELLFKHGLMGGSLSSAWTLLTSNPRSADLEYAGLKKIGSRRAHELRYVSRAMSELSVSLYFDQQTFEHVRTEYRRVVPAPTGNRAYVNIEERDTVYKLTEEFSVFNIEQQLNLPHVYKIHLTVDAQSGTFEAEWLLKLTEFMFNQKIDPNSFSIDAS
jgi:hypothetical protein